MIVLPIGAFTVQRDPVVIEQPKHNLILSQEDLAPKKPNTGTIIFTSEELNKYQGCKVVFRENFMDSIITIKGNELLYFRDFNSSIYYVTTEDKEG